MKVKVNYFIFKIIFLDHKFYSSLWKQDFITCFSFIYFGRFNNELTLFSC